ncbi:MAG TPA: deoxyribonuclease IV [Mycobacteriales bacterium]|jgi:deoxyribonuclease-4|nr:deoxyribonuclease IV [Mycobacteriales bacterium]
MQIGAHVDPHDPVAEAKAREADLVQFFLSDPQGWKKPQPREDATALRASGITLYVHAPYIVNVASTNNKIRIPSRKILADQCAAAAEIGAAAVIVHGGHVGSDDEVEAGYENWRKTFERMESPVPVLIENTAGGDFAMARTFDRLARLWDALDGFDVGFCLDTCHAHAGGEELVGIVERVLAITGRIDLVHANDSKDPAGSGRDRHENFGSGQIDPDVLVSVVELAGAPVVCETPGGVEGQAADIAYLRGRLPR